MEKIDGAKLIGSTWHYYKRVPKRLVEAYGLPEFKRGTMKTQDLTEAKRLARAMLNELDELEAKLDAVSSRVKVFGDLTPKEQERLEGDVAHAIAALPADQKLLIQKAGSVWAAGREMNLHERSAAFQKAGLGAGYALKDEMGEEYDPDDRELDETQDAARISFHEKKGRALRDALTAADVIEPTANTDTSLRGLLERFCQDKGYVDKNKIKNKTRGQYAYAVRRFIEYHGDVPLADLTKKHLTSFARDFVKLPKSSRKDVRPLAFWDAVKVAEREGLPRVIKRTRDQNLTLLKVLMSYAVNEGEREDDAGWGKYTVTEKQEKQSAAKKAKRHVFSRDEVKSIVEYASKARDPNTVDYWAPLFGACHGLRIEEVSQLHVADVLTEENFVCLSVTDEADLQKVKNSNTFRTIPVHREILDRGFSDFVARRRKAGGKMLFMEAERWGNQLHEISHDGQGRYGTFYGSRFGRDLSKLEIVGNKVGFHSFRHAWTDLARNSGIGAEIRRALAGRDSDSDEYKIDRTEDRYGHGFSIAVLAESLNKLQPLD
ncbi:hypothetical protein PVW53_06620 [Seohaeicola sp. SP36]|uniref:DUF6538 domain-containing protein n=1 Tax=unclassified Seohaeicola TaxID=2641111 RepID=UPI00237B3242|nr:MULTISPECIES: DUF6538 domain-containing protein [unclassified Seohaeicola]MDD9706952.1 hypothetical protein [Seohaeicola sp. 4SK31]MDD9735188.1 hypothetical protein [Seohaeicola sp. SP36]